jgi:hypothetical protein
MVWTGEGLLAHAPLVAAAAAGAWLGRAVARVAIPAMTACLWCGYVAWVGGDIFCAWRQLVPVLPALAMLAGEAVAQISRPWPWVASALVLHVPLANGCEGH